MRWRILASLVVVYLLVSLATAAQDRGVITGTVTDAAGAPVAGVTVQLLHPTTGAPIRTTTTDARGAFTFDNVAAGAQRVRFVHNGYATLTQPVTVTSGQTQSVAVRLTAGPSQPLAPPPAQMVAEAMRGVASGVAGGVPAPVGARMVMLDPARYDSPMNAEAYDSLDENPFRRVVVDPLSTFSIDVDTASYANVRRFLNTGSLPPAGAVRIEELINYFRFDYPQPKDGAPFSVTTELAECPWNTKHRLALIGLQGRELPSENTPPRNLVFLLDVSGSMMSADKLPLVRNAMRMLVDELTSRDRVAIVVYAGATGLVLPSTAGDQKVRIHDAIANLEAGGSTNGGDGIRLAYKVARAQFIRHGVNRVILATDGDFNVGTTSQDELVRLIETERASGVFLSVLGVGTGNLKDSTMEKLADKGNGNYAYLDSLHEARKVLVQEAGSTLVTIAKDVKIQIEFNPRAVAGYRLIGYENRILRHEDFNDDKKDAGEIGAGHSVTAIYEIVPAGVDVDAPAVDRLKYQTPAATTATASANELLTVKLRYKAPDGDESRLISTTVDARPRALSANLGFASAVAEAGMLLRASKHAGTGSLKATAARARQFRGTDAEGYRAEFIKLVELAESLTRLQTSSPR